MEYDAFTQEWNGKQVTKYGGECVALVAEYEAENNRPIVWGDAHVWANNPTMLEVYNWTTNDPTDPNQLPNHGDIIVWPLPNEHIAFFDHNLDNQQFMSFGQNSGGPLAHFQQHSWANVAGWYSLKTATPPPTPATYQVVESYPDGKQIQLNKQPTNLWGMNYHFDYMKDNPVEVHNQGEIWTVTNKVHHEDGYDYYRRDGQVDGFNVLDCDDYTPPPPLPPAAPLPIPTSTDPYIVVKTIMGFSTSNDAANHTNAKTTIDAGTYYVFNRRFSPTKADQLIALNVTLTPGKAGSWINPDDNVEDIPEPPKPSEPSGWTDPRSGGEPTPVPVTVVPPSPDAWKKMIPLNEERVPELYISMNKTELSIRDLEQRLSPLPLEPLSPLHIAGYFTKDGVKYGRTVKIANEGLWYGIPWGILEPAEYKGIKVTDYITLIKNKIAKLIHDVRY